MRILTAPYVGPPADAHEYGAMLLGVALLICPGKPFDSQVAKIALLDSAQVHIDLSAVAKSFVTVGTPVGPPGQVENSLYETMGPFV